VQLAEDFPPDHLNDFLIVEERAGAATTPAPLQHRPRNVIVLVMESTSARYLDLYNSAFEDVTPRLNGEVAHSLVFDNFYCHVGLTANAVVAIALSIYPGMTWREYTKEHPSLPGVTVADVLRPLGYRTAFIHNGDLEYTNQRGFLTNRGFDSLWDYRDLDGGVPDPNGFSWGVADQHLVTGILKWIDQDRERPFFVLSWTIQAHHPYTVPVQNKVDFFRGNIPPGDDYDLDLYLNALHETDREIGRLLDGLRERGIADDTLVVITGDHGEAFGHPHDTYGHGAKLFQENVNVPLILWNPKMFHGERSATIGSQIDINPTVLHILGIEPPAPWQGYSLFAADRPPRAYFYAANDDYLIGVREGRWKYIYNATTGRDMLFDLEADPEEQQDVARHHTEIGDELRKRLAAWMRYEQRLLERLQGAATK
jgi:lipoteichoic acid synthase